MSLIKLNKNCVRILNNEKKYIAVTSFSVLINIVQFHYSMIIGGLQKKPQFPLKGNSIEKEIQPTRRPHSSLIVVKVHSTFHFNDCVRILLLFNVLLFSTMM